MKILLVDDDSFLRDMYAIKFTEAGHTVSTAASGEECLSKVGDNEFDVVLLDMVMPTMTGVELLQKLQDLPKAASFKKIVLSNQGETYDKDAAKAAGADGYIVKAELIPSEVVKKIEEFVK